MIKAFLMLVWGSIAFVVVESLVFLPLYILGLPLAWAASRWAQRDTGFSVVTPSRAIITYKNKLLDWWVGNREDGIWPEYARELGLSVFGWFIRNPVTNLRFTPVISTLPRPEKIRYVGSSSMPEDGVPVWFICWQDPYVGVLWQNESWGIWYGWKVKPEDRNGVPGYRRCGIGIACQLMRFKK